MARALKEHPELKKVEIQGHTDSVGDDFYNLKLGQERAESVKRALVKRGRGAGAPHRQGLRRGEPPRPQRHAGRQGQEPAGRVRDRRTESRRSEHAQLVAAIVVAGGRSLGGVARAGRRPSHRRSRRSTASAGFMTDGYRDQSGAIDERDIVGDVAAPGRVPRRRRAVPLPAPAPRRLARAGQRPAPVRLGLRAQHRRRSDHLRDPDRRRRRRRDRLALPATPSPPSRTAPPIPPISLPS